MSRRPVRSASTSIGASSQMVIDRSLRIWRVRGIDERPAAGRDDANFALDEPCDQAPFPVAEIGFAVALEDFGGRIAGGILDRRIAVDERQAEPPREAPADGRFAGAHQADKDDWAIEAGGQLFHARGYTAGRKVGQKPIPVAQARERDAANDPVPDCPGAAGDRRRIPACRAGLAKSRPSASKSMSPVTPARAKPLLFAAAVVALALPALAQESILPPGFGNEAGRRRRQRSARRPAADRCRRRRSR